MCSPCPMWRHKLHESKNSVFFTLYLWCVEQCLAHSSCLVDIYWMNEWSVSHWSLLFQTFFCMNYFHLILVWTLFFCIGFHESSPLGNYQLLEYRGWVLQFLTIFHNGWHRWGNIVLCKYFWIIVGRFGLTYSLKWSLKCHILTGLSFICYNLNIGYT